MSFFSLFLIFEAKTDLGFSRWLLDFITSPPFFENNENSKYSLKNSF